jgi:hypothetical protein
MIDNSDDVNFLIRAEGQGFHSVVLLVDVRAEISVLCVVEFLFCVVELYLVCVWWSCILWWSCIWFVCGSYAASGQSPKQEAPLFKQS